MRGSVLSVELIRVPAAPIVGAPAGHVLVHHGQTRLSMPLEVGAKVVLVDTDGEYRSGHVTQVTSRDDELVYAIYQGVRLPPEAAAERLDESAEALESRGVHSTQSILDLLGELRDRDHRRD